MLVVAHVHYPELWGDIEDRLARMPEAFDLIVTVTEGAAEGVISDVLRHHPKARIDVVANRGRDWAPLVALANEGALSGYDAIAKVHTKKSEHRIDGDGWRLQLLDGIFESPDAIRRVVALLREDRDVGLVVPTGHVAGTEHWGSDLALVEALASRLPMAFEPSLLSFPSGSMFWCRPWLLERVADLCLTSADFEPEAGHYDGTTAHALERLVGIFSRVGGMQIVEALDVKGRLAELRRRPVARPRVLAFYLPQYHVIAENEDFWGAGFTDWVNVRKAKPLFLGHRQPLLPSSKVGFYDLSDPEVLRAQANSARESGIDGFVFHYYWFNGRRLLEAPLQHWFDDPTIDFPLAICWANEPWTRRWDGLESDVLIGQEFTDGWEARFWDDVSPYMADPRYIRVGASPLLVVYRIGQLPDPIRAINVWREKAAADGFSGLHVAAVEPSRELPGLDDSVLGAVDSLVSFPPGSGLILDSLRGMIRDLPVNFDGDLFSMDVAHDSGSNTRSGTLPVYPGVMPGWDNTARRGSSAYAFLGSNPLTFRRAVSQKISDSPSPLLFVNAWNEWAEGAVLESSARFGNGFATSIGDALGHAGG